MPKIRVGVVKGGRGFATKKFKAPKPVPAKFKGERVAPVNHDAPGGTYHGKHTASSMRKRMADPNKPIAPAGPGPRGMTYTRYKQETGGTFKDYHKNVVNNPERRKASDAHAQRLKNDPDYHKVVAAAHNEDRRTRLQDAKDDYKESGWSSVKSTKTNPKPKNSPVTSKPPKPTPPKPSSPVARRPTNAQELIAHVRKEQGTSNRPKRKTRYKD